MPAIFHKALLKVLAIKRKQPSKAIRDKLWEESGGCCQICGGKLTPREAQVDHIVPLAYHCTDKANTIIVSLDDLVNKHKPCKTRIELIDAWPASS